MIVALYADRRTSRLAGAAHDLAVALSAQLKAPVGLHVDRVALRLARHETFRQDPRPVPASVRLTFGGLTPGDHVVVALVAPVTEQVLTTFDLSHRILVVADSTVQSLRTAQRAFRLCHDVGYRGDKVLGIALLEDPDGPQELATLRAGLKDKLVALVPAETGRARDEAFGALAQTLAAGLR